MLKLVECATLKCVGGKNIFWLGVNTFELEHRQHTHSLRRRVLLILIPEALDCACCNEHDAKFAHTESAESGPAELRQDERIEAARGSLSLRAASDHSGALLSVCSVQHGMLTLSDAERNTVAKVPVEGLAVGLQQQTCKVKERSMRSEA
jgi:hypothetical protein